MTLRISETDFTEAFAVRFHAWERLFRLHGLMKSDLIQSPQNKGALVSFRPVNNCCGWAEIFQMEEDGLYAGYTVCCIPDATYARASDAVKALMNHFRQKHREHIQCLQSELETFGEDPAAVAKADEPEPAPVPFVSSFVDLTKAAEEVVREANLVTGRGHGTKWLLEKRTPAMEKALLATVEQGLLAASKPDLAEAVEAPTKAPAKAPGGWCPKVGDRVVTLRAGGKTSEQRGYIGYEEESRRFGHAGEVVSMSNARRLCFRVKYDDDSTGAGEGWFDLDELRPEWDHRQPAQESKSDDVIELKTVSPYFQAIWDGHKLFEYRLNDRPYAVGANLRLREYDANSNTYSGRIIWATVTYMVKVAGGSREHVVMSLKLLQIVDPGKPAAPEVTP